MLTVPLSQTRQDYLAHVDLRRHRAEKTMRWTPRIISEEDGVAQIVRNHDVAVGMV